MTTFMWGMVTGVGILAIGFVVGLLVTLNNYNKIKAEKEELEKKISSTSSSSASTSK